MLSKKPLSNAIAAHSAGLVALLDTSDPAAEGERARSAARHFERTRRARPARHQAPARPEVGATSPQGDPSSTRGTSPPGGARGYFHAEPTRSPVLNAFLHELGAAGAALVPEDVHVFDEHTLAPRLVELARQRVVSMLLAVGRTDVALVLAQMPPIANERAARLFMRQAVHVGGDLGAVTRDYARYHRRSGAPDRDDQHASCIMAAFAGRLNALGEKLLGPHVRDSLRDELARLTSQGSPTARRARASELRAPQGAGRPAAQATALHAAATRRPRGR